MVGHELNNIAVPLEGYAELAGESAVGTESARNSIEEMRAAIARIKALAADLESLGEPSAPPMPVAIGDCMPEDLGAVPPETPQIDWRCSASTAVAVDRGHARRAIRSLGILAARTRAQSISVPTWEVLLGSAAPARCASCGAAARRKDRYVLVRTHTDRPVSTDALRAPFGPARAGRLSRRLTLAVMVYSAHCANGHIFLDEDKGSVSLAFPPA
jgi:hypothetical protein